MIFAALLALCLAGVCLAASVKLRWTAPGDDGAIGRATSYELRYSLTPITAANFASATPWLALPLPGLSGAQDSVTVSGLSDQTSYFFALKAVDDAGNVSSLSNVVQATTPPPPDTTPPAAITDLRVVP